ncbi:MAG: hypothetical protein U5N53_29245 [Mycobacterium sp.]|nr:hypothetical protein [Mycobacterium sp.]
MTAYGEGMVKRVSVSLSSPVYSNRTTRRVAIAPGVNEIAASDGDWASMTNIDANASSHGAS